MNRPDHRDDGGPEIRSSASRRVISRGSNERVLRRSMCPALETAGLAEAAIIEAVPPYDGGLQDATLYFTFVCHAGVMRVLVNGRPIDVSAGGALFVHRGNQTEIVDAEQPFHACVLGYSGLPANWSRQAIVQIDIHAQPIAALLSGVFHEFDGDSDTAVISTVLEIINAKLRRALNPHQTHSRLQPVWDRVSREPAARWTTQSLARVINVSAEHLRRLCHAEVGCSPMERVRWLRSHEAARRLRGSNDTIASIAEQVGYGSERAFRGAFEKTLGAPPSVYRKQERLAPRRPQTAPLPIPRSPGSSDRYPVAVAAAAGRWETVSLSGLANATFAAGERPWFGELPLVGLKAGAVNFHGAKFQLLNESRGPTAVLLRSSRLRTSATGDELSDQVTIPVGRQVSQVYILHAAGWVEQPGPFARYEFILSDNTVIPEEVYGLGFAHPEEPDGRPANIQDWYFAYRQITRPSARSVNITPPRRVEQMAQYLYTMEWTNPWPSRSLKAVRVVSDPSRAATLALLALSFLKAPTLA